MITPTTGRKTNLHRERNQIGANFMLFRYVIYRQRGRIENHPGAIKVRAILACHCRRLFTEYHRMIAPD